MKDLYNKERVIELNERKIKKSVKSVIE